jgi:hypothetical protein
VGNSFGEIDGQARALLAERVHGLLAERLPLRFPGGTVEPGGGAALAPTGGGDARVPTADLVEACAARPEYEWRAAIDAWLRRIDDALEPNRRARAASGDVESQLRCQVLPALSKRRREKLVATPYGEGSRFDFLVVLHDPHEPEPLTRKQAERLLIRNPGLHAIANTMVHELPTFDLRSEPLTRTESAMVISRPGSPYVSSALLTIERYLSPPSPHGALLAVPRRSALVLYPLRSSRVSFAVQAFARLTRSWYEAAEDRCTPKVYRLTGRGLAELSL